MRLELEVSDLGCRDRALRLLASRFRVAGAAFLAQGSNDSLYIGLPVSVCVHPRTSSPKP